MTYKLYNFFLLPLVLIPNLALAQNEHNTSNNQDIIVSASKIEQTVDKVGSSISVLTRETLLKRGDRTIADSISRVPGVSLSRSGGIGSVSNIRVRGSNQSQVLVLIDGVRVSDTSNVNRAFDFGTFMITDIERIEVLRGNQSSLYGSDAIGGVINIITFKPQPNQTANGTAFLEGGSFGTVHGGASIRGKGDKLNYGLSVNHFHNDGFSRRNTGTERDGNQITNLRANIGVDITNNLNLMLNAGYELANIELDSGFSAAQASDDDKELIYGGINLTHFAFNDKLKSQLSYRATQTDRHTNSGTGFMSDFKGTNSILAYQGDIHLQDRDVLTFGANYETEAADNLRNNKNKSLFINYVKGIGSNLTLTVGGRVDNHEQFGTQETFRSTIAYNIPITHTKLHASYGTGFRAPSLFQLFSTSFGTATLNPEESRGFDIGISQDFWHKKITTDITYFSNETENMVGFGNINCTSTQIFGCYRNIDKANVEGIEVSLDAKITDHVNLFGNYTFTNAEDATTNLRLLRRPKHLFNIGTDFHLNAFHMALLGRYVGDQIDNGTTPNDSFFVADAQASYDINKKITLYTRVENIFDTNYQEVLTFNTPGVSAYTGIRLKY